MNTQQETIRCYEVTEAGIRAVDTSPGRFLITPALFRKIENARGRFAREFRPRKPRVAPRMAIGVVVA